MHQFPRKFPRINRHLHRLAGVLVLIGLFHATTGLSQSDDFNDGIDDGWDRYDPIGSAVPPGVGTWSFPNANSYRIQTSPSPSPGMVGPGRAGSTRTDASYTDFYVSVDIINWDPALEQAIGLLARLREIGLGTTDGYAMTYQVADGDIDITTFTNEVPADSLDLVGSDVVNMQLGESYRYVFEGKGVDFTVKVYLLPDTVNPITAVSAQDATWVSGFCGLLAFDNTGTGTGRTDVTFDNYFAADSEPPLLRYELNAFGDLSFNWTTNSPGYILQATFSMDAIDWVDISPPYTIFGEVFVFLEDRFAQPARYYQLRRP